MTPAHRHEAAAAAPALRVVAPLGVAVVTVGCFVRILGNELVSWDDYGNLVENTAYRGLGWEQLRWMFTTFHMGPYQPLSWLTYAVDWLIWGGDPFGFHLTNLALHAGAGLAFYFLMLRLRGSVGDAAFDASSAETADATWRCWAAGAAAMLFAIHPLRVESVAWATERRDVLSGVLFVLTLIAYFRYAGALENGCFVRRDGGRYVRDGGRHAPGRARRWYAASLVAYLLCVLAKATAMTLPVVLLLLDAYPLRRIGGSNGGWRGQRRRVWIEKLPFVAIALATAVVALFGQREAGALGSVEALGIGQRIAVAAYAACFYVWKTVLPVGLSPMYELPAVLNPLSGRFVAAMAAVAGISIAVWLCRRRAPAVAVAWFVYLVMLSPVSGLAHAGKQIAADRYTYLPCMAFAALAGVGLARAGRGRALLGGGMAAVLAAFGAATVRQTGYWHDSKAVWERGLAVDPQCAFAHYNLSLLLAEEGKDADALAHAAEAYRLRPAVPDTAWNYGLMLTRAGHAAEGAEMIQRVATGRELTASERFEYGAALASAGHEKEAAAEFERALEIDPADRRSRLGLGLILARGGEPDRARPHLDRALSTEPVRPDDFLDAATAWLQGRMPEAAGEYLSRGVSRFPENVPLLLRCSWLRATHPRAAVRNGPEAVRLAERAVALTGGRGARALAALAAAYAEAGRREEALSAIRRAWEAAAGDEALREEIRGFEAELSAGRPIRAPARR